MFSLVMTLGFLPISLITLMFQSEEKLRDEDFQARWGQLFSNLNVEKRAGDLWARAYFLIFVIRRIIFIATGFLLSGATIN